MIYDNEVEKFISEFDKIIDLSDVITISGSIPKGVPIDIYSTLIKMIKEKGKKVILDTSNQPLKEGIKALPTMIKPNSEEIEMLLGLSISNKIELLESAVNLHKKGIELVVVSLGKDGALLVCDEGIYHGKPPKLEVVNTVGCGDSMVAAFAVGLSRGYSYKECLKYAISISAANAMSLSTGSFEKEMAEEIYDNVEIKDIEFNIE